MNESSILKELTALFDGAEGKVCPVLATDSLLTPATFVRVLGAERDSTVGALKVTFELKHRYRDCDPSDGIEAFSYLEHLVGAAEKTGTATLLSLEGGGAASDGSVAECCARLEYTGHGAKGFRLVTEDGDISDCVTKITLKDNGIVRSRQYIYDAFPVRDRVGADITVGLVCTAEGVSGVRKLFGGRRVGLTLSFGSFAIRGDFVLGKLSVDDTAYCELVSSGETEFGSYDAETGAFSADSERRSL